MTAWQDAWEHFTPFLAFTDEVRRVVYTTDESVNLRVGCERSRAGLGCGQGVVDPRAKRRFWD